MNTALISVCGALVLIGMLGCVRSKANIVCFWNPCFYLSDNLVILYENTPQILEPARLFKWQVIDADV